MSKSILLLALFFTFLRAAAQAPDTLALLRRPGGWQLTQAQSADGEALDLRAARVVLRLLPAGRYTLTNREGQQTGTFRLSQQPSNVLELGPTQGGRPKTVSFIRQVSAAQLVLVSPNGTVFTYRAQPATTAPKPRGKTLHTPARR